MNCPHCKKRIDMLYYDEVVTFNVAYDMTINYIDSKTVKHRVVCPECDYILGNSIQDAIDLFKEE